MRARYVMAWHDKKPAKDYGPPQLDAFAPGMDGKGRTCPIRGHLYEPFICIPEAAAELSSHLHLRFEAPRVHKFVDGSIRPIASGPFDYNPIVDQRGSKHAAIPRHTDFLAAHSLLARKAQPVFPPALVPPSPCCFCR